MAATIKKVKCTRCGYEWYPRSETLPERCPHCKSPYWNRARERAKRVKEPLTVETVLSTLKMDYSKQIVDIASRLTMEDKRRQAIYRALIRYEEFFQFQALNQLNAMLTAELTKQIEADAAKNTKPLPGFETVRE
jgi:predicted  nucleic acid-binding Zn-ribbon protein